MDRLVGLSVSRGDRDMIQLAANIPVATLAPRMAKPNQRLWLQVAMRPSPTKIKPATTLKALLRIRGRNTTGRNRWSVQLFSRQIKPQPSTPVNKFAGVRIAINS